MGVGSRSFQLCFTKAGKQTRKIVKELKKVEYVREPTGFLITYLLEDQIKSKNMITQEQTSGMGRQPNQRRFGGSGRTSF